MSVFITGEITNATGKTKPRKKYHTKYSNKYQQDYEWVGPSEKGDTYALCRWCQVDICIKSVGAKGLRDHDQTGRHKQKAKDHFPNPLNNGSVYPVLNLEVVEPSDPCVGDASAVSEQRPNTPQTPNTPQSPKSSSEENIMVPDSSLISNKIEQVADCDKATEKDIKTLPGARDAHIKTNKPSISKVLENMKTKFESSVVIEYDDPVTTPTSETTKTLKKKKIKKKRCAKSMKKETSTSINDDLTCNVCGQEYSHWKQLKQHLLDHIMHAHNEQLSKQKENVEKDKSISKSKKCRTTKTKKKSKVKIKINSLVKREENNVKLEEIDFSNKEEKKRNIDSSFNSKKLKDSVNSESKNISIVSVKHHKEWGLENKNIISDSQEEDLDGPDETDIDITEKQRTTSLHCRVCGMTFYSRGELAIHQREEHNNGRPYKCSHCEKCFTTKNHMEVHTKHKHCEGPNPCQCSVCGKVLSSRTNLRIHMRIHK
ncbi:unnamed protein product, partial [Meganyctiphanes norvegica]